MTVSKVGTGFSTSLAGFIAGPNDGLGTVTDGKVEVVYEGEWKLFDNRQSR
jgi:hypothetical protein